MDILSLWKQLPASNIVNTVDNTENEKKVPWAVEIGGMEVEGEEEDQEEKEPIVGFGVPSIFDNNDNKSPEAWTVDPPANQKFALISKETPEPPDPLLPEPEPEPKPEPEPEPEITTSLELSTTKSRHNDVIPEQEPEPEPKQDDATIIDIDLLGRWPKPFDIEPWIRCGICDKWFKTKEIRTKHAAKYHT